MDGEDYRQVFYQRVGGVQGAQEYGNQRGLPVVAVDYIGGPNVFGDFDRGAAKFAVTLGVVGKIPGAVTVNSVAVEIAGMVNEEVAHAVKHGAVGNGWKSQPTAQRNCDTGHDHHTCFYSPVARQDHSQFMALGDEGFGQRFDYVGEAAGL